MNAMRTRFMAAAMAAILAFLPVAGASARGGFHGGGFRSSPSVRSFSSSRSFTWGSSVRPSLKPSSNSFLSRRSISGSRGSVSDQRGLYDSAMRNGTLFSSKTEAAQAFRSRYAKDYSSTFASEPSMRPNYIPSSATIDGRNVNIVYSPALGGYGYYHPSLGRWLLYDALADSVIDSTMYNRGYYWGGAPVYVSHGPSFIGLAFAILFLLIVAAIGAKAIARARDDDRRRGGY